MEKIIIKYRIKSVYGNDLIYIVDPEQAKWIDQITRRKTITKFEMTALSQLTKHHIIWEQVL
jgi:hypothetical protein